MIKELEKIILYDELLSPTDQQLRSDLTDKEGSFGNSVEFIEDLKEEGSNPVTLEIAEQMKAAYKSNQIGPKGSYTEHVWFPANQILKMAQNIIEHGGDGLRIHFGRYNEEIIDQINALPYGKKIPENYKDMNTLILAVTKNIDGIAKSDYFEPTPKINKLTKNTVFVFKSTKNVYLENRGCVYPPDESGSLSGFF